MLFCTVIAYVIISPGWTNVLPDCVIAVLVTVISGVWTFSIFVYALANDACNSLGDQILSSPSATNLSGIVTVSSLEMVVSWILSVVVVVPVPPVVVPVVPAAPVVPVAPVPAVPWLAPPVVVVSVSAVSVGSVVAGSVPSVACSSALWVAGSPDCSCVSVVVGCSSCVVPVVCSL